MGCCQSVPTPNPQLVGLWISTDTLASDVPNLMECHEYEKRTMMYGCAKAKKTHMYKPCSGSVLEISPSGYVRYIEMDGEWAINVYSGPIQNWEGPEGVWSGCCAGCCNCCPKGCVHFDVSIPPVTTLDTIHVNGREFQKKKKNNASTFPAEEGEHGTPIPTATAIPVKDSGLGSGLGSVVNTFAL